MAQRRLSLASALLPRTGAHGGTGGPPIQVHAVWRMADEGPTTLGGAERAATLTADELQATAAFIREQVGEIGPGRDHGVGAKTCIDASTPDPHGHVRCGCNTECLAAPPLTNQRWHDAKAKTNCRPLMADVAGS